MHKEIWTIGRILQWTEQYFQSKEMDTPRLDGEVLLSHVFRQESYFIYIPIMTNRLFKRNSMLSDLSFKNELRGIV